MCVCLTCFVFNPLGVAGDNLKLFSSAQSMVSMCFGWSRAGKICRRSSKCCAVFSC